MLYARPGQSPSQPLLDLLVETMEFFTISSMPRDLLYYQHGILLDKRCIFSRLTDPSSFPTFPTFPTSGLLRLAWFVILHAVTPSAPFFRTLISSILHVDELTKEA
jgi:hypothetical protein